ncbi:acyltransferase [Winogradskyella sp.]|uniref:acyltransferase n=1 Tax=Winogradskyella sp. TaxID=1883156 RepID=UPI003BAC683B
MLNIVLIKFRKFTWLLKGMLLRLYLNILGCKVGNNLKCKKWPLFRTIPKKNIFIGNNVNIGYRITLDISHSGKLILGNSVNLTQDIIISSAEMVTIGNDCLIAEHVSIRDGDHKFSKNLKINQQELSKKAIKIGTDVWIGAGSRVLKGAIIETGCIIAANSIVLEKTKTEEFNIYAGSPIKHIGIRP